MKIFAGYIEVSTWDGQQDSMAGLWADEGTARQETERLASLVKAKAGNSIEINTFVLSYAVGELSESVDTILDMIGENDIEEEDW